MKFTCLRSQLRYCAALIVLLPSFAATEHHDGLPALEAMALENDAAAAALLAKASGLEELAVVAEALPDPKLKLASLALPLDTFDLDQEPMTQLQLGWQQRFTPRRGREARSHQLQSKAQSLVSSSLDRRERRRRDLRWAYIEWVFEQQRQQILRQAGQTLADLSQLTRDYYAAGRAGQHDVHRVDLELLRVQERRNASIQRSAELREEISELVGAAARLPSSARWPELGQPPSIDQLRRTMVEHPKIRALAANSSAARAEVDVAHSTRRSDWTLDISYGARQGSGLDGRERADFLSATVTIDLPIFAERRQGPLLRASLHQVDAADATLDDQRQRFIGEFKRQWARLENLRLRKKLFDERLLLEATAHRETALDAYQSGASDVTGLMRAQITEYELLLDRARLVADELNARAALWYLAGGQQ